MAKLDVPFEQLFKGRKIVSPKGVTLSSYKSTIYVRARPKKTKKPLSPARQAWVDNFKLIATLSKTPDPRAFDMATKLAKGTNWYYRDVLETAMSGKLIQYQDEVRITTPTVNVSRTAAESLTANTALSLTPDTLGWDNNAFWNPVTNPERITFRTAGLYLLLAEVEYNAVANGYRDCEFWLNGSTFLGANRAGSAGTFGAFVPHMMLWYFHANEWLEVKGLSSQSGCTARLVFAQAVAITPEALL